jgi:THO complex subunit 4
MSGKLDQSLDEILSTQRKSGGRRQSTRKTARPATKAPVGGVHKNTKPARGNAAKPAPARGARNTGESKIIVSNLVRIVPVSLPMLAIC